MKKFGFVGLGIILIWVISIFLNDEITGINLLTGGITNTAEMVLPIATLALAYHILSDEEHKICSYILLTVAFISTIFILLNSLIKDNELLLKISSYQTAINIVILCISSPFAFRSKSAFHAKFKIFLAVFIALIFILSFSITFISGHIETRSGLKFIFNLLSLIAKCQIIAVALSFANPIIAYTTSNGSHKMPKLVPVPTVVENPATPTITQGINYGNLPVPEGVVASTNPVVTPQVIPTTPISEAPIETPPVPSTQVVADNIETLEPLQESTPTSLNVEDVAPALQFIIDDKKQ